jgi:uncharacterized protein YdeI (YjbR/CyaY-like superfamily)
VGRGDDFARAPIAGLEVSNRQRDGGGISPADARGTGISAEFRELVVPDVRAWREWLGHNHADGAGVLLVLAKKGTTSPTSLTYDQALEEAICFGWIDGQVRRRDERTYFQRFTPRRARSRWSQRNTTLAERLISEGRMQASGIAEVERAKADGRWEAAYAGPATARVPDDLAAALAAEPKAKTMFRRLTSQNRYAILYRIEAVKRPETRARKIAEFVAMLARGETVHPQTRRNKDAS